MKNLFAYIAALFGAFVLSVSLGVIFMLYRNDLLKTVFFVAAGVFFAGFAVAVLIGVFGGSFIKRPDGTETEEDKKSDKKSD